LWLHDPSRHINFYVTRAGPDRTSPEFPLPRLAYVNGRYVPLSHAGVSIEDRGFQFADSLYEVIAVLAGTMLDGPAHEKRLARSCAALGIDLPMASASLRLVLRELLRRNRVETGLLYLQVTRGVAPRDHGFPDPAVPSTLVASVRPYDFQARARQGQAGQKVVSVRDIRWRRRDIKTTALVANVLAKQQAKQAGAGEAVFVDDDGMVSEGGSTNMFMVDAKGRVITHPLGYLILPGIAREALMRAAHKAQIKVIERRFSLDEMKAAPEAFFTSTTAPIMPITQVDSVPIGKAAPGPVSARLHELLWRDICRKTGFVLA
jgi:D-alanine transaminase